MKIEGQAALVTGGASGLGEATARELARLGAKVAVLDVNLAQAEKVAAEIGGVACQCDITDTDSLSAALAKASQAHGPARILMNIAGIGSAKRVVQKDGTAAPLEDFARVININLIGTYNASRLFAAECAKLAPLEDGERGVMMFTASVAAFDGQVGQQAYSASKGGLVGMTRALALELAPRVRVNAIAPSLTASEMTRAMPEKVLDKMIASIPLGRQAEPAEIAETIATLASPATAYVTGQVLVACGGRSLAP
jgi:NAD(P)-dependent dehydrogenase (short-subunit alcohol dehydrogenase family)